MTSQHDISWWVMLTYHDKSWPYDVSFIQNGKVINCDLSWEFDFNKKVEINKKKISINCQMCAGLIWGFLEKYLRDTPLIY